MTTFTRRSFVLALVALAAGASCRREARCQRCGMVLDPSSRWRVDAKAADGGVASFDTPKCAFTWAFGHAVAPAALTFRAYYGQQSAAGDALSFAVGSDVQGPMGDDFVPVEPALATKFRAEHEAKQMLAAKEITREMAEGM